MASRSDTFRRVRRGSVLMEYVIVLVFVGAVLSVASSKLFYGYGPDDNDGKKFGPLGLQIQGFYQRTMGGIALPIP